MGEEIESRNFADEQSQEFMGRVRRETQWLGDQLAQGRCGYAPRHGYELEGYLIDLDGRPVGRNMELLEEIGDKDFVHEIARFNWEINGGILDRNPHLLKDFLQDMEDKTTKAHQAADRLGLKTCFIGILPTLREDMLSLENMSPVNRYFALTERLIELRRGQKIKIQIERNESVSLERSDLMVEAAATSLQVHTQVSLAQSVSLYNLSQILAAPLVAASANSPFFMGRKLWDESRIPVFEQAVPMSDLKGTTWRDPVTLGQAYCKDSLLEIFQENHELYPAILPVLFTDPLERLRHLKLLNGQVWRWNRPIVSTDDEGQVQLRIELRPLPAGPTNVDMVANIAFYLGLMAYYAEGGLGGGGSDHRGGHQSGPSSVELNASSFCHKISFAKMKHNFYSAARLGMKAQVHWGDLGEVNMQKLLHDVLFAQAKEGLKAMGMAAEDISYFMDQVLKPRLRTGFTGAAWQKSFIDTNGPDFQAMTLAYHEQQRQGQPVHQWRL